MESGSACLIRLFDPGVEVAGAFEGPWDEVDGSRILRTVEPAIGDNDGRLFMVSGEFRSQIKNFHIPLKEICNILYVITRKPAFHQNC